MNIKFLFLASLISCIATLYPMARNTTPTLGDSPRAQETLPPQTPPLDVPKDLSLLAQAITQRKKLALRGIAPMNPVLLHGPPSCGKTTLMTTWLAQQTHLPALVTSYIQICRSRKGKNRIKHNDILYHLAQVFNEAERHAQQSDQQAAIVTINNIENVLNFDKTASFRKMVETYISANITEKYLQGLFIFFIGETSTIPGLSDMNFFKKAIHIPLPSYSNRHTILRQCATELGHNEQSIDWDLLARESKDLSHQQLRTIIHEAATAALIAETPLATCHVKKALESLTKLRDVDHTASYIR